MMTSWSRALALVACAVAWVVPSPARPTDVVRFECLRPPDTRDIIQTHSLIRPFRAMIEAARSGQGEPIGIRLCRYNGQFVYTVMLLKRDGLLLRFLVDAEKGQPLNPQPKIPPPGGPPLLGRIPVFPGGPPPP